MGLNTFLSNNFTVTPSWKYIGVTDLTILRTFMYVHKHWVLTVITKAEYEAVHLNK